MWDVTKTWERTGNQRKFLLTHPVWDVTRQGRRLACRLYFYSHIPCGMWHELIRKIWNRYNFYSHIPCGMWLFGLISNALAIFISTHTSRVGCDSEMLTASSFKSISTHTSRVGCDIINGGTIAPPLYFYSHIPCGMWLLCFLLRLPPP